MVTATTLFTILILISVNGGLTEYHYATVGVAQAEARLVKCIKDNNRSYMIKGFGRISQTCILMKSQ